MTTKLSSDKEPTFSGLNKEANSSEDQTHAFVVRFWLERRGSNGAESFWRGVIEHVLSGRKKYLIKFDEITEFISAYLKG